MYVYARNINMHDKKRADAEMYGIMEDTLRFPLVQGPNGPSLL